MWQILPFLDSALRQGALPDKNRYRVDVTAVSPKWEYVEPKSNGEFDDESR